MISIVIPVYNGERYLNECIDSCIAQTYKDIEIIVISDGSTDSTREIAWQYGDKIRYFHKKNGGTASALNMGMNNMKGEWFKWVSADDVLYPDAIENIMKYVNPNKPTQMYYTDYDIIDENSNVIRTFKEPERNNYDEYSAELFHNFFGNGSTSLIHKTVFTLAKFNETLPYNEDYDFWLNLVLKHNFEMKHIPEITLKYRVHNDSITSTKRISQNKKVVKAIRQKYSQYLTSEQKKLLKRYKTPIIKRLASKLPDPILTRMIQWKKSR